MAPRGSDEELLSELLRNINDSVEHEIERLMDQSWTLWVLGYHADPDPQHYGHLALHLRYRFAGNLQQRCFVFDGSKRHIDRHFPAGDRSDVTLKFSRENEDWPDDS